MAVGCVRPLCDTSIAHTLGNRAGATGLRGSGAAVSNRQVPGGFPILPLRPAAVRCGEELAADVGGAERGRSQMTAESCFI